MRHSRTARMPEPGGSRDGTTRPRLVRLLLALMLALPLAILLIVCQALPAAAETRIALVIGINAYQNAPALANPVNDARAIGDALRRLNFDVVELIDPDRSALFRGVRNFGIRAETAETAVVYYAGHGVQVDRENYLIPADAKLERTNDLKFEALRLSDLLDEVSRASKIGIVLLDSCRNNPFVDRVARSMTVVGQAVATTQGMARVDNVPRNTMVVMAAKADQIAEDGQDHSPFAAAVLAYLQIPGLELSMFVRSVRDVVLKATANRQEPYAFSSLGAEPFYFYPRPPNRPPVIGPVATLQVPDTAGPTRLGFPAPTDPDLDPLSVRIIGLPRGGEVRIAGRKVEKGEGFSVDQFMTGTFKPDGTLSGPVGTVDILVEDGRGGSVVGSLPVVVLSPTPSQTKAESGLANQADAAGTSTSPASLTSLPMVLAGSSFPGPSAIPRPIDQSPRLPPAQPPPSTSPAGSPGLAEARTLALGVPCALLDVRETQTPNQPGRLLISGLAAHGAPLDSFLHLIGAPSRAVGVSTEALAPSYCAALGVMADVVRSTRERAALRLVVPASPVPTGGPIAIAAEKIPNGALYIDLYAPDGSVQHLRRGPVQGGPGDADVTMVATASGTPGQHLLVAIATAAPLESEQRPASESESVYLPVLHHELARLNSGSVMVRAELVPLSVIAATRPVALSTRAPAPASPAPRPPTPINPRCKDIVSRVILGESPSDSDLMLLRTSCGK